MMMFHSWGCAMPRDYSIGIGGGGDQTRKTERVAGAPVVLP